MAPLRSTPVVPSRRPHNDCCSVGEARGTSTRTLIFRLRRRGSRTESATRVAVRSASAAARRPTSGASASSTSMSSALDDNTASRSHSRARLSRSLGALGRSDAARACSERPSALALAAATACLATVSGPHRCTTGQPLMPRGRRHNAVTRATACACEGASSSSSWGSRGSTSPSSRASSDDTPHRCASTRSAGRSRPCNVESAPSISIRRNWRSVPVGASALQCASGRRESASAKVAHGRRGSAAATAQVSPSPGTSSVPTARSSNERSNGDNPNAAASESIAAGAPSSRLLSASSCCAASALVGAWLASPIRRADRSPMAANR